MATISVTGDALHVKFSLLEKVLGLVGDQTFPLSAVSTARVEAEGLTAARGVRAPGLGIPGRRLVGTWRGHGRTLVSVRRDQPAVVVELDGQRFVRVVIGTDAADSVAAQLQHV